MLIEDYYAIPEVKVNMLMRDMLWSVGSTVRIDEAMTEFRKNTEIYINEQNKEIEEFLKKLKLRLYSKSPEEIEAQRKADLLANIKRNEEHWASYRSYKKLLGNMLYVFTEKNINQGCDGTDTYLYFLNRVFPLAVSKYKYKNKDDTFEYKTNVRKVQKVVHTRVFNRQETLWKHMPTWLWNVRRYMYRGKNINSTELAFYKVRYYSAVPKTKWWIEDLTHSHDAKSLTYIQYLYYKLFVYVSNNILHVRRDRLMKIYNRDCVPQYMYYFLEQPNYKDFRRSI